MICKEKNKFIISDKVDKLDISIRKADKIKNKLSMAFGDLSKVFI